MDLQELKITIRSILISAKHNLTTLELVNDFQVVEGKNLEHILRDFGFRDWDDENLVDTFRDTFVYDRYDRLAVVTTNATRHIANLVATQRGPRSKGRKSRGKPRGTGAIFQQLQVRRNRRQPKPKKHKARSYPEQVHPQLTKYEKCVPLCSNTQPTSHSRTGYTILPDPTYADAGLDLTLNPEFNKMPASESPEESSSESSSEKLPVRIVYDNELTDKDSITVFEFDFEVKADISVSIHLWFIGDCESPFVSKGDISKLNDLDCGIPALRLRIRLRDWAENGRFQFIDPPKIEFNADADKETTAEKAFRKSFTSTAPTITSLNHLVKLIRLDAKTFGESLLLLHEKVAEMCETTPDLANCSVFANCSGLSSLSDAEN